MLEQIRSFHIPTLITIYQNLVEELDKRDYFQKVNHDNLELRTIVKLDDNVPILPKYSFILTYPMPEQEQEPKLAGFYYAHGIDNLDGRAYWTTVSETWLYEHTLQLV